MKNRDYLMKEFGSLIHHPINKKFLEDIGMESKDITKDGRGWGHVSKDERLHVFFKYPDYEEISMILFRDGDLSLALSKTSYGTIGSFIDLLNKLEP